FPAAFFTGNFWVQLATTFSFQPWHSLAEFRRYILRFFHVAPFLSTMECIQLTPYNEYESIVLPLTKWLKDQKVRFVLNIKVVDLDFAGTNGARTVERIHYLRDGLDCRIEVGAEDLVFATLGSITSNSSMGSMNEAPGLCIIEKAPSWLLWERISKKAPELGTPSAFNGDIEKSKWVSFTVTFRGPEFIAALETLTGRKAGAAGVITIKDSSWLLSFAMVPSPCFRDQPEHVSVCWGYGLFPEKTGNHVKKKMSECTGEEILTELCSHLGFNGELDLIVKTSACIPCFMPYVTSQFLPRTKGARPEVVPRGIANLALLGQYCELPDDIAFTMEYSVRSAQKAVYSRLNLDRRVSPVYKGHRDLRNIYKALRTIFTLPA
ncbi:MAG TPA: oleate hydratase, partial [Elusimicrobiales bacterium]|nr:oleate hydratase [Elusimicrobiales bacterium]